MRKMKEVFGTVVLVVGLVVLFGVSTGSAATNPGYPALIACSDTSTGEWLFIATVRFRQSSFGLSEADNLSSEVNGLLGLLSGTGVNCLGWSPSYLKNNIGITDWATLDSEVFSNYSDWGFPLYVWLDLYKVAGYAPYGDGKNINIDLWIANGASFAGQLGLPVPPTDTDLYVGTIQVPDIYLSLLNEIPGLLGQF